MSIIGELQQRAMRGEALCETDALALAQENIDELTEAANAIREQCCGAGFDFCTIINARSGDCTENCRFCSQSSHYGGPAEKYGMLAAEKICESAVSNFKSGMRRFSLVTSGRRLNDADIDAECEACRQTGESCGIALCASNGLLKPKQFERLRAAGVTRYHCNLETSRNFFPSICTTHTYEDKIAVIRLAREAGMEICSGGIIGLGETMLDRIQMAVELRDLKVESVPLNVLNPIPGTPLENNPVPGYEEIRRTIAIYRFLLPSTWIRMAGGRALLADKGELAIRAGLNALISGDMLTTAGISPAEDIRMARALGFNCD